MKSIVFANQKGGVAKTTLAFNLAAILSKKYRIEIMDRDPQKSLTHIWRRWEHIGGDRVGAQQINIIDLPPGAAPIVRKAMVESTHVIVPITPSMIDLESSLPLYPMYQKARQYNEQLKILWVINAARIGSNIVQIVFDALRKKQLPYFAEAIPHSVAIAESMSLAIPLCEYKPNHPAVAIYERLLECL